MRATVEFLDSYYKSIKLAGRYSTDEIMKGKMIIQEAPPNVRDVRPITAPWPAPAAGRVALSMDGSFQEEDGTAAAGMVLRNPDGTIIFAAYRFIFHCNDLLEAELHAMMQGMALAIEHSEAPVILQSDSSEALSCLATDALQRSAYGQLVREIKHLSGIREFVPQKLSRVQNRVVDRLANYSRTE